MRDGSGRCAQHPKPAWAKRAGAPKRMRGRKLQRARERLFAERPLCERCEEAGQVRLATQRDHRVPLAEGGTDDPENIQALCDGCHAEKTLAESIRGRARSAGGGSKV